MFAKSSPVSVELEEEVSTSCVHDEDVEEDDVKDTSGSFLDLLPIKIQQNNVWTAQIKYRTISLGEIVSQ